MTGPGVRSGRSTVYAPRGVVATCQPLATGSGLRMLEGGGNAEDLDEEVARSLAMRGHDLAPATGTAFGGAQAVPRLARGLAAGSDPRKDGVAAGH